MFGTSQVLVIVQANDVDRYEALSRIHAGDGRVRVILDRRRGLAAQHRPAAPGSPDPHAVDRRSHGVHPWKDGHFVVETGYS